MAGLWGRVGRQNRELGACLQASPLGAPLRPQGTRGAYCRPQASVALGPEENSFKRCKKWGLQWRGGGSCRAEIKDCVHRKTP